MSYAYGTNILAYILAAAMLVVVVVTQLAASAKIGRNGFIGIRIPPTMASDAAWAAGHKAARLPSWIGFALVAITAGVAQFIPGANAILIAILLLFLAWSVVLLGAARNPRSANSSNDPKDSIRKSVLNGTVAGLAAARARGRNGGCPFKMTPAKIALAWLHGAERNQGQRAVYGSRRHAPDALPACVATGAEFVKADEASVSFRRRVSGLSLRRGC